jgi:hypothetical protein
LFLDKYLNSEGYKHLQVTESHIKGGNLAGICAITANYHVLDAIKIISGFSPPVMTGKIAELNFMSYEISFREFEKQSNCQSCNRKGEY